VVKHKKKTPPSGVGKAELWQKDNLKGQPTYILIYKKCASVRFFGIIFVVGFNSLYNNELKFAEKVGY
jgi:hypothetical protein